MMRLLAAVPRLAGRACPLHAYLARDLQSLLTHRCFSAGLGVRAAVRRTLFCLSQELNEVSPVNAVTRPWPVPVQTEEVLSIKGVAKTFSLASGPLPVLDNIDLSVGAGEFICIVGASGCGKSTLLRLIAGLDADYSGSILHEGRQVAGTDLSRGLIFQEHRLFPWLTVEQNIQLAFGGTKVSKHEQKERVQEQIRRVGLEGFEQAWPHQISGGMAQRAAIARALVIQPRLLLLDEPLGALDALTRLRLQQELQRLWQQVGITMIMVTHDIEEAVFLADRIVVMDARPGRVRRVVPVPLAHPRDRTSAEFNAIKHDVLADFSLLNDRH